MAETERLSLSEFDLPNKTVSSAVIDRVTSIWRGGGIVAFAEFSQRFQNKPKPPPDDVDELEDR